MWLETVIFLYSSNILVSNGELSDLRVVSLNMHKGLSPFGLKKTSSEIKEFLETTDADVVCLQEVESRFLPSKYEKMFATQLEYLVTLKWPYHCYQRNSAYPKGHHGNAVLSRWPIEKTKTLDLSLNQVEKRGLLHVSIRHPSGELLQIMCTHFSLFLEILQRHFLVGCRSCLSTEFIVKT